MSKKKHTRTECKTAYVLVGFLLLLNGCGHNGGSENSQKRARRVRRESVLPTKGIKQVTLDEAILCKNFYKEHNDPDLAAKYIERALALAKDHTLRGELMLELADTYMQADNRAKASIYYNQFKTLYPGSKKIKYVLYQEIVSNELELLDSNRDQSKTETALQLAQGFLKEYPDDSEYGASVRATVRRLHMRLFKSELGRVRFYLNKYEYDPKESSLEAAHKRLSDLLQKHITHLPDTHEFEDLEKKIDTSSSEKYQASLELAASRLMNYLMNHEERPHVRAYAYAHRKFQ